jgi:Secretion system C-terminal sorting domain
MKKLIILLLSFFSVLSFSQNVFNDNFSTYNLGDLTGQGSWNSNSTPPNIGMGITSGQPNAQVVAQTLSFTDYGLSSKAITTKPNSDSCVTAFTPFGPSDVVYVGMVIKMTATQSSPDDFFRVMSNANNYNTTFRLLVTPGGSGFNVGIRKGGTSNTTVFTTGGYAYNSSHLVILKYTQNPGTNDDELKVFVDPAFLGGEPATASALTVNGMDQSGSIDRMVFRQNFNTGMPTGFISLVSVAKTWEDLTFIPLSTKGFSKSNFEINSNNVSNGVLNINSSLNIAKATLNIFDVQGRLIENKTISLTEGNNDIAIQSITNSGIYIVQIADGENKIGTKINVR